MVHSPAVLFGGAPGAETVEVRANGEVAGDATATLAAMTAANLPTEWNGAAGQRIQVTPLSWQLRRSD